MTTQFHWMDRHGEPGPAPLDVGRVICSRLRPGESRIAAPRPSIKFVLEGEERYQIDGRTHVVTAGSFLLLDRGADCLVHVRQGGETRGLCIYLPVDPTLDATPCEPLLGRATMFHVATSGLGTYLRARAAELHRAGGGGEGADAIIQAAASELHLLRDELGAFRARIGAARPHTRDALLARLEQARAHLHEHAGRPVSQAELARIAGVSQFHLARLFRAAFGLPPAAYHRQLRLDLAARLLDEDGASVATIAARVGYSDASAFSHAYRRAFGVWPSIK